MVASKLRLRCAVSEGVAGETPDTALVLISWRKKSAMCKTIHLVDCTSTGNNVSIAKTCIMILAKPLQNTLPFLGVGGLERHGAPEIMMMQMRMIFTKMTIMSKKNNDVGSLQHVKK